MTTLGALAVRLRCPHCHASLLEADQALRCGNKHSFDLARAGHVALLPPRGKIAPGDSTEMVAARKTFLAAGHYSPIADAIVEVAHAVGSSSTNGVRTIVDLGSGTGYYLAALLEDLPDSMGIALDASRSSLRRAVRAHPRVAAILCDVWQELPLKDATADLVLNVFAPRNGHEIARVLAPEGALIVVTPRAQHLHQLVCSLGSSVSMRTSRLVCTPGCRAASAL